MKLLLRVNSNQRILIGTAVLLAVGIGFFLLRGDATIKRITSANSSAVESDDSEYPLLPMPGTRDPKEVRQNLAAFYRMRSNWPPNSYPITKTADPLQTDFTTHRGRSRSGENQDGPSFQYVLTKNSFHPDELIVVRGLFRSSTGNTTRGKAELDVIDRRANRSVLTVPFRDDGKDGDRKADDGSVIATFLVPPELKSRFPGALDLVLKAEVEGTEIIDTIGVNVAALGMAYKGGQIRDRADRDETGKFHLYVDIPLAVSQPGRYRIEGTLQTLDGKKVVWAARAEELQPGQHIMTLRFYGRALCDAGLDGPYQLSIGYSAFAGLARSQLLNKIHVTAPYQASQFSCEPYNDPVMRKKAEAIAPAK